MKYPLVRRRRSRNAVLALVPEYAPGTVVLLYRDKKFILCVTDSCCCYSSCLGCLLRKAVCYCYTHHNKLIPLEDIL